MEEVAVTALDRFWAEVQLDLLDLPRPWDVLSELKHVHSELHDNLCQGERWLLAQTDVAELRMGWAWWLRLYRQALDLIETGESKGPDSPPTTTAHRGPDRRVPNE